jgi:hypothetical protein
VFSIETLQGIDFYENYFSVYNPNADGAPPPSTNPAYGAGAARKIAINSVKMEIMDYSVIPSTMTLLKLDSISQEEA